MSDCKGCKVCRKCAEYIGVDEDQLYKHPNGEVENPDCARYVMIMGHLLEERSAEASDAEVADFLQKLVNQLSTREAAIALGWSPKSYGSLKGLCDDYGVEIPDRTNQHFDPDHDPNDPDQYGETVEIRQDGAYYSDKLLRMNREQCKDPVYLMEAHGFDPNEWELLTARNNIWNVFSDDNGVQTLYSSKITVKPLKGRFNIDEILEAVRKVEPLHVKKSAGASRTCMLEIPLFDMHLGVADLEHYADTVRDIVNEIRDLQPERIVFAVGSDLFHNDNFKHQTSNGTIVDGIDFPTAWADATAIYRTLIEEALKVADIVNLIYVKGNHDESMSWTFCQMLVAMFPQLVFDLEIEERKVVCYYDVAIGFTHGEKGIANIDRSFLAEFPAFAAAKLKEVHSAHKHHETVKDQFGVTVRILPTGGKTDKWTRDKGFVGTCKRFQLFVYGPDCITDIKYV